MEKQINKKIDFKVWLVILIVIALAFVNTLISIRHWEINQEISLLSSSISKIITYHKEKAEADKEKKDDLDDQEKDKDKVEQRPVLNIMSGGYYYSSQGDQLGVGPLPPIVDKQTNYWIFWEISSAKGVRDIKITGQLPDNVVWTNKKTILSGQLQFGEVSRQAVWTVDKIDLKSGPYKIGFEIGLIPGENDIGKILDLITSIKYQAINRYTGEEIQGSLDKITTDLKSDNLASGKGSVVQ